MMFRSRLFTLFLSLLLLLPAPLLAENSCPLVGSWAFSYEPETLVLRLDESGSAWYRDAEYTWSDQDNLLTLTNKDGESLLLRYMIAEDQTFIYPRTVYHRGKNVEGQGGLIGIWEGEEGDSSYVFTPAGAFLEDSVLSGSFMADADQGTFLLHYGDAFADTLCYYTVKDDLLTVEYPWPVVPLV